MVTSRSFYYNTRKHNLYRTPEPISSEYEAAKLVRGKKSLKEKRPDYLTATEAMEYGIELAPDWSVRFEYGVNGDEPKQIYVSPDKWEYRDLVYGEAGDVENFLAISPEGQTFTRQELRDLEAQQGLQAETPKIEQPSDYQMLYAEYQRVGGKLGPEDWALTGAPLRPEAEVSITDSLSTLYPETTPEQLFTEIQTSEEAKEDLLSKIVSQGRTPESEALINTFFDATPEDIENLFATPEFGVPGIQRVTVEIDGVKRFADFDVNTGLAYGFNGEVLGSYDPISKTVTTAPEESKAKDIWDAAVLGAASIWHRSKQYFVSALPNLLFRDMTKLERVIQGDDWADVSDARNQALRNKFRQIYATNNEQFDEWVDKNPQLMPPDWAEGDILTRLRENPAATVAYEIASAAPFIVGIMATTIGVTAATGNPAIGLGAGVAVATPAQTQDVYEAVLMAGGTEEQATGLSALIGPLISAVEVVGDLPFLKAVMPSFFRFFRKEATEEVAKQTVKQLIKKGITTAGKVELAETMEEVVQGAMQNAAVRVVDEHQNIFEGVTETAIKAALATLPLAAIGGGGASLDIEGRIREGVQFAREQPERGALGREEEIPPEGRKFIGVSKSTEPTQKRAPWTVAYEYKGKEHAGHFSSRVEAAKWAKEKLGVELDPKTLELISQPTGGVTNADIMARPPRTDQIGSTMKPVQEVISDIGGFEQTLTPRIRAKALEQMNMKKMIAGKGQSRKEYIEASVAEGAVIGVKEGKPALVFPDGSYMRQSEITKTALDYAKFLIEAKSAPPTGGAEVTKPLWEMTDDELLKVVDLDIKARVVRFPKGGRIVSTYPKELNYKEGLDVFRQTAEKENLVVSELASTGGVTPEVTQLKDLGWSDARIAELDAGERASIIRNKMTPESALEVTPAQEELTLEPQLGEKLPTPEEGEDVGLQADIFGGVTEVRIPGKGKVTQVSMDDQLRLQQAQEAAVTAPEEVRAAYEAQAEIEGIKVSHQTDPVASYRLQETVVRETKKGSGKFVQHKRSYGLDRFIDIKEGSFPDYFTLKQARQLYPGHDFTEYTQSGTPKFNKVPRDVALDQLSKEFGMTPDEIADRVMEIRQEKRQLKEHEATIKRQMTETPLPAKTELTPEEVTENWNTIGHPKLTLKQAQALAGIMGDYILSEDALTAYEVQRALWSRTRGERAEDLKARMQELIVGQGLGVEEAFKQAVGETLSGELPRESTDFFEGMSDEMRSAFFTVVFHNKQLQEYPYEMAATITAVTNALAGNPIPRKKGTGSVLFPEGGSAWDRINFVFGKQQKVLKAIEKMAEEKKPLEDIVDGVFRETGGDPIPIDQETADYLRNLSNIPMGYKTTFEPEFGYPIAQDLRSQADLQFAKEEQEILSRFARGEIDFDQMELERREARDRAYPLPPVPKFDAPIDKEFKQKPLSGMNFIEQRRLVTALKNTGWAAVDIGNLLRAMKTAIDNSFLRQGKVIASGHPLIAYKMHKTSWRAMFNQSEAEATWERIIRRDWFPMYDKIRAETGTDPLRVPAFAAVKGTAQYRTAEEFGFPTVERWIPRMTSRSPLIRPFERAYSAGINEGVAGLLDIQYNQILRDAEKVASGKVKLPVGEAFDIEKEFTAIMDLASNLGQRATLPEGARGLAPVMNAFFFAFRSKLGRFLAPTHLLGLYRPTGGYKMAFSARVMREAWRDFIAFNSLMGGIMFLGSWLGLWDLEDDPRNAEFMSARIGKTRIDPWAGYRQFVVLYARLVTRTGISSVTGAEYDINPENTVRNFIDNSLSPMMSTLLEFWTGRNFLGAVVDYADKEYWIEKVTAMSLWDIYEAFKEEGWVRAAQVTLPAIYGEGVQTYTGDWEDNWNKLGLSKYPENLVEGITEPPYTTEDWWKDTSSQFKGVDPGTLTETKGFPPQVKAIAEARVILEYLNTLPNDRLVSLNANPAAGATFSDYRSLWIDRNRLVHAGDDAEWTVSELQPDGTYKETTYKGDEAVEAFDKDETPQANRNGARPKDAELGNFSQRQFALLNQYWAITDEKKQAEFLEKNKAEIGVNPRYEALKSDPQANAQLAIWGQANILTREAYDIFKKLAKQYDIPDNAIPKILLPPETSIDTHFDYLELVSQGANSSNEAKLLLLKDHLVAQEDGIKSYVDWRNESNQPLQLPAEQLEYYQLKVDNSQNYDDLEAAQEDDDQKAIDEVRARKVGDETFHDVERRVEAIGKGTREVPVPNEIVNSYVEHMSIGDETSPNSAEAKLNRYDNPELNNFLMSEDYWGKQKAQPLDKDKTYLDNYLVPRWRIDVKYRTEDEEYNTLQTTQDRQKYLEENEAYRMDRRRREALSTSNTLTGERFPLNQVENFVNYYEIPAKGKRQERFLVENPVFADAMHNIKGIDIPAPQDVPSVQYDDIYDQYSEEFDELSGLADNTSEHYIEDVLSRAARAEALRFSDGKYTEFGLAELERNAYGKFVPDRYVDEYVGYYTIIGEGKPDNYEEVNGTDLWYEDDWFLMENEDFYKRVYKGLLGNEKKDFSKIPSRGVLAKYLEYLDINSRLTSQRENFRWDNLDLDAWLVLKFDYEPITEKRKQEALTTRERLAESIEELERRLREHP